MPSGSPRGFCERSLLLSLELSRLYLEGTFPSFLLERVRHGGRRTPTAVVPTAALVRGGTFGGRFVRTRCGFPGGTMREALPHGSDWVRPKPMIRNQVNT